MDITEAFRAEDISKTDFFDFVVTPDNNQSFQTFRNQMRAVNVYLEDENNEPKETNNNTLIDTRSTHEPIATSLETATSTATSTYDPTFWNCDKETVRLETAILEDLNKYCWSQETDVSNNNVNGLSANKLLNNNNTDGHIYTLTVLNGVEQTNWYRPPLPSIIKEEDGSLSSTSPMEHIPQPTLDIDSILSIIPNQINGYNNNYEQNLSPHDSLNTDGLIKSETFTYDDSGYADTKDELANALIIDTPMLEAHDSFNNNNNNDWKIDNNNSTAANAESLLRSALQGKTFIRYNSNNQKLKNESHSELRRALSTPPTKTETTPIENEQIMSVQLSNNNIILFDDGGGGRISAHHDSDNPSSTQSMDDLLLSQLDSASYPEDYEKLKRIANEVAESVQQYCQLETVEPSNIYINTTDVTNQGNSVSIINQSTIMNPPTNTAIVTSSKPTPKKYKRTNSNNSKQSTTNTNIQTATSTSNGVRKERSLHYCSICSKGFKDKYSVNVHIRTHTGEKPFACSLCGKSFRQKAHLAKHYQTHIAQKNATAAAAGNTNPNNKKTLISTPVVTTTTPIAIAPTTNVNTTTSATINSTTTPTQTTTNSCSTVASR